MFVVWSVNLQEALTELIAELDVKIMADHEKKMRDDEMKKARGNKNAYDSMKMFCDLINNTEKWKKIRESGVKGRKSGKGESKCVLPRNFAMMRSRSPRKACLIN